MKVTVADVADLVLGADLLSSGGASHGSTAASWLRHTLATHGPATLVPPESLDPDACCLAVGGAGSMTIMAEKLPAKAQFERALRVAERRLGRSVDAIAALNSAGINALVPVIAGAELDLPVVDADGMGRIFPYVEQTVYTLGGLPVGPVVLAGVDGDVVTVDPIEPHRVETLIRPVTVALGGWCFALLYPMTGAQLAEHGIAGATSLAVDVGRTLRRAAADPATRGARLAELLGGTLLTSGIVTEVHRPARRGFPRGAAVVCDLDDQDLAVRLEAQNEYLLALRDGLPLASVPDVICAVDRDTCAPVGVEELRYGQVVDVIARPAAAAWHTPAGRALAGPEVFGYSLPGRWA